MIKRLIANSNTCDGKRLFYFLFLHFTKFFIKGFTYMYKVQMLQGIKPYDNNTFLNDVVFSDEATFHKNECVSK